MPARGRAAAPQPFRRRHPARHPRSPHRRHRPGPGRPAPDDRLPRQLHDRSQPGPPPARLTSLKNLRPP
ncbi:MAG: hypothetical protein EON59_13720 [Alphaproteobacteria bacterium]|nr:MAG: hypothetical protein EON59_13720 [Alphaproteobacteria bacterium]